MKRRLLTSAAIVACTTAAGLAAGASAAPPERTAAQALREAAAPRTELVRTQTVDYRGFRVERFQQRVDGYPVIGGETTVVASPGRPAELAADATSRVAAKAEVAAAGPSLSGSRAIGIARRAGRVRAIRAGDHPTARLAVRRGGELVWQVEVPAAQPMRDLEVLVDARSGAVLRRANLLRYATGKARLYVPNPPAEQGSYSGIGTRPRADHRDHNTPALTKLREPVVLPRIKAGQACLKGRFVEARYGHPARALCRRSRNWHRIKRANNRFEALMTYFHIDRTQAYVQSLGFKGANGIDDRRQHVIADAFRADNSFYSPQDHKIRYGTGGVDDAEDGDVIVHEYGHALEDAQVKGPFGCRGQNYCQAGALGEGFGDYMSAMMTLQTPGLPDPTGAAFCIFDWDGVTGYNPQAAPCGRIANDPQVDTLPAALAKRGPCDSNLRGGKSLDVHCVGEVWTHGLIDLRLNPAIGERLDVILLASQFLYVQREKFAQALDALVTADNNIYGGAEVPAICNEMHTQRGISGSASCG